MSSTSSSGELSRLRDLFYCPISYQLFEDPVIENNSCRHTFERIWIEQWLEENSTCPISRNSLSSDQLISHTLLKDACALLSTERTEPLTEEDMELLKIAEQAFLSREREPVRVSEEIHKTIMEKVAQKIKAYSKKVYC